MNRLVKKLPEKDHYGRKERSILQTTSHNYSSTSQDSSPEMVAIVYSDMHLKFLLLAHFFYFECPPKMFCISKEIFELRKVVRLWKHILQSHPKLEEISREEGGDFKTLCSISFATHVNIKFK